MLLIPAIYCFASGLMLALATPSFGVWQLSFVAFIPLLFITENQFELGKTAFSRMFFLGFVFSYVAAASCFYWIANMSWIAMIVTTTIYALIYSLFVPGIILGLKVGLSRTALSLWTVFLWVSLEIVLSDLLLPIPSMAVGYFIWPLNRAIQIAEITGVSGISFWIITVNVIIFSLLKSGLKRSLPFLSMTILITCLLAGYGYVKSSGKLTAENPNFTINTVYTSILSEEKNNKDSIKKIFEILTQETRQSINTSEHPPDLVIWPETSVPVFLRSVGDKEFIRELLDLAQTNKVPILMGARSFQRSEKNALRKFNAAFLVPEKGFISQEYHKNFLAPFVETNPLEEVLPQQLQWLPASKFNAGKEPGIISLFNNIKFGVVICYEIFFPNFVRKSAIKESGFVVNITNDHHAFGNLRAAYKIPLPHLVFRAVENGKFLIRSANWGYSTIISPTGEIIESSSIGSTGYLSAMITPNHEETFFSTHGFLLAKVLLFMTFIWSVILFKRASKLHRQE